MTQFWIIIATQVLIAAVLGSVVRDISRAGSGIFDLGFEIRQLGRVVRQMAITQEDVKDLANAVGSLVDITKAALDAAAGDKDAKDQALADLAALRTEVEWLNDADLDQKIDDMIAAAAAAIPSPDPVA